MVLSKKILKWANSKIPTVSVIECRSTIDMTDKINLGLDHGLVLSRLFVFGSKRFEFGVVVLTNKSAMGVLPKQPKVTNFKEPDFEGVV